jgi:hypothetical protein
MKFESRRACPELVERGRLNLAQVLAKPSLAWDNLFDNRGSPQNISILDRVKDRAQDPWIHVPSATGLIVLGQYFWK